MTKKEFIGAYNIGHRDGKAGDYSPNDYDDIFHLEEPRTEDCISREKTLEKFCDYVGAGMSMNDFDALYDIVSKMPSVQPKIIETIDFAIDASDGNTNYFVGLRNGMRYVKSLIDGEEPQFESCAEQEQKTDRIEYGTDGNPYKLSISNGKEYEQKSCEDCIFKNEWQKIGKLISVVLEKQTEPKTDILDKIRAEIESIEISGIVDANTMHVRSAEQIKNIVLEIIDKYRQEG